MGFLPHKPSDVVLFQTGVIQHGIPGLGVGLCLSYQIVQ